MFFFKQKTAYEMRISDWSSDVCSSDLLFFVLLRRTGRVIVMALLLLRRAEGEMVAGLAAHLQRLHAGVDPAVLEAERLRQVVEEEIGRASCRDRVCQYV